MGGFFVNDLLSSFHDNSRGCCSHEMLACKGGSGLDKLQDQEISPACVSPASSIFSQGFTTLAGTDMLWSCWLCCGSADCAVVLLAVLSHATMLLCWSRCDVVGCDLTCNNVPAPFCSAQSRVRMVQLIWQMNAAAAALFQAGICS